MGISFLQDYLGLITCQAFQFKLILRPEFPAVAKLPVGSVRPDKLQFEDFFMLLTQRLEGGFQHGHVRACLFEIQDIQADCIGQ